MPDEKELEEMGDALDEVTLTECTPGPGDLMWFTHAKFPKAVCKVGKTEDGRWLKVWVIEEGNTAIVLTAAPLSDGEIEHLIKLAERRNAH